MNAAYFPAEYEKDKKAHLVKSSQSALHFIFLTQKW